MKTKFKDNILVFSLFSFIFSLNMNNAYCGDIYKLDCTQEKHIYPYSGMFASPLTNLQGEELKNYLKEHPQQDNKIWQTYNMPEVESKNYTTKYDLTCYVEMEDGEIINFLGIYPFQFINTKNPENPFETGKPCYELYKSKYKCLYMLEQFDKGNVIYTVQEDASPYFLTELFMDIVWWIDIYDYRKCIDDDRYNRMFGDQYNAYITNNVSIIHYEKIDTQLLPVVLFSNYGYEPITFQYIYDRESINANQFHFPKAIYAVEKNAKIHRKTYIKNVEQISSNSDEIFVLPADLFSKVKEDQKYYIPNQNLMLYQMEE